MTSTRRRHALTLLTMVIALTVAASGCMKLEAAAKVDVDGSGVASMDLTFGPELSEIIRLDAGGVDTFTDELRSGTHEKWEGRTTVLVDDSGRSITAAVVVRFDTLDELTEIFTEGIDATGGGDGEQLFTRFELTETDGIWELNAAAIPLADTLTFHATPGERAVPPGMDPGDVRWLDEGELTDVVSAGMEVHFTVELPAPVDSANGNVDGNTVTWDLTDGGSLRARTVAPGTGSPLLFAASVAVFVAGVGAAAVFVVLQRHRRRTRTTPPPPPQMPPGWYRARDGVGEQYWNGTNWTGQIR